MCTYMVVYIWCITGMHIGVNMVMQVYKAGS